MFETALRNKFRFPFRGIINSEDLFDLSLQNLDSIFKNLNSQLKRVKEESLLETKSKEDEEIETKIEIIKYIVKIKKEEEEKKLKAIEQREKKQRIMEILANKQDKELENKSEEELMKMLEDLG